jgi:Transposase
LKELQSFSVGLMKDEAAVRAAMTYDWSNGQVEGNVNRLKMIKRMMFGRAGFALLKVRVLHECRHSLRSLLTSFPLPARCNSVITPSHLA